jgi:hypothetical protein
MERDARQPAQSANLIPKEGTMAKRIWTLTGLVVSMLVSLGAQRAFSGEQAAENHVVPLKTFSKLATDKRVETVSGDPAKTGAPFVIRIHAEAGYVIMPHTHPVDENIVVVKGSVY